MKIIIYKLEKNDAAIDVGAQALAEGKWSADVNQEILVMDLSEAPEACPTDLSCMVFLGHANTQTIGKYNTEQFVAELCRIVPEKNNKKEVKDIYLIGCEVGKITKEGCLAQNIAFHLKRVGFENIKVHAIASPEVLSEEACMVVSSFCSPSLSLTRRRGGLEAFVMNPQEAAECDSLETQIALSKGSPVKLQQKLDDIHRRSRKVVKYNDAKKELDKAQHTFIPGESLQKHLIRMRSDPDYIIDNLKKYNHRDIVLAFIAKRIQQHTIKSQHDRSIFQTINPLDKNPKELIKNLARLYDEIKDSSENKWKKVLEDNLSKFKFVKLLPNELSSTYALLKLLKNEKYDDACSLLNYSDSNERKRQKDELKEQKKEKEHALIPPPLQVPISGGIQTPQPAPVKMSVTEETPPHSRDPSPARERIHHSVKISPKGSNNDENKKWSDLRQKKREQDEARERLIPANKISELTPEQKSVYAKVCQDALKEYVGILEVEINQRCFCSFFYTNTKDKKRNKCQELAEIVDPDTFFYAVQKTINKNGTVTSGRFSDRARTLLTNILTYNVDPSDIRKALYTKPEIVDDESSEDSLTCCC